MAERTTWLTAAELRLMWADAPEDDFTLGLLLDAAEMTCIEHSRIVDPADGSTLRHWQTGDEVPAKFLLAEHEQCVAIWRSTQATVAEDTIGFDQTAVRVWPMDKTIRAKLQTTRPVVR